MENIYTEKESNKLSSKGYEIEIQHNHTISMVARPHLHSAIELLYFCEGEHKISTGNQERILYSGEAVMFRINELHRVYSLTTQGKYYVIKFLPSFIMDLAGSKYGPSHLLSFSLKNGDAMIIDKETSEKSSLSSVVEQLISDSKQDDIFSELGVKVGLSQIALILLRLIAQNAPLAEITYQDAQFAQRIYETIAFINGNYASDITAKDCADRANISYSYFSRVFKEYTGKSFKQYLNDVRFDRAEKALYSSDASITDILTSCGFNNAAYFSAQYKKRTGVTPSEARKALSSQEKE